MSRTLGRLFGIVGMLVLAVPLVAQDPPAKDGPQAFKLTLDAKLELELDKKKQTVQGDTELRYTWQRKGLEKTLVLNELGTKVSVDGKEAINASMSRARFVNITKGQKEEVLFEKAPEQLKKTLKDGFESPIVKIETDKSGKETKRTVVAGDGAKAFIDNGMITNALLFHPPYEKDKDEWQAEREVSTGSGGTVKGMLTYKKKLVEKAGQVVSVSGTLTNEKLILPGNPFTGKDARYVINGEETFDPALQEWVAGKIKIDLSFKLMDKETEVGGGKGFMLATFERLPPAKK